jgi:membrane-associated protein
VRVLELMLTSPLLLGLDWMDPEWLLERFGEQMFWVSVIIIFVECGLLFPILPGDSLLFAVGMFIARAAAGQPGIDVPLVVALMVLCGAAFAGNVVGYEIGRAVGAPLANRQGRFLKPEYFEKTESFFETYGNKALVLGRFVPIVRTFVTVVAGIAKMERRRFVTWSALGAVLWVCSLTLIGYFLGGVELIQKNIEAAALTIVAISVLPMVWEWWKGRRTSAASLR